MSVDFIHPRLGRVIMTIRSNATRLVATRHPDAIRLTVPPDIPSCDITTFLDHCADKFPEKAQRLSCFSDGMRIECPDVTFVICRQNHIPRSILATPKLPCTYIEVGSALDLNDPEVSDSVKSVLRKLGTRLAGRFVTERARRTAERIGIAPRSWKISSGRQRLGYCNSNRDIALSSYLLFMPEELQEYIICHELAHLTEMNHSARFHALCNYYCGGHERRLKATLRSWISSHRDCL